VTKILGLVGIIGAALSTPFGGASAGAQPVPQQAPAPQPKIDEYKMTTYQVVFVTATSSLRGDLHDFQVKGMRERHHGYVADLVKTGRAVIGGPFSRPAVFETAYVVAGTRQHATEVASADPGVQAGYWAVEILSWMGPEGWFQPAADVAQAEKIYFGFLVTGENTTAVTPDEQKLLMRGHLDYMDGQSKIGKLVLAGPLVNGGRRRGLIAYRVPTMAEAVERASADPMIKAGRMAPELFEWTIPKGILK
jgi:uncharacterized protein YciI